MTFTEKELLYDLSLAVLALLIPDAVKPYDLTNSERVTLITKRLEAMRDEDARIDSDGAR